ncbi:Myocyte-specific enhancer factor 2D [Hypsizygus marmoreus]|uniref:Myocyte-specific enhancer factor 2D n=1 Tax=Hypsizygus marmoreus TaxID=39966 RepID=A0A369K470_HYPMA|nr:Myocyte-specific enhancer factor 2D [Hypsizygus marmoreus]
MGRRKIQIQPITRKNGLFKKAYELGVLCSVEIAVIIFDERNGHEPKLHQYSSCDVRDIIQRHLRHDGEKDTRGPSDFSDNAGGSRRDIPGEVDDDDVEEDVDDVPVSSSSKRGDIGYKRGGDESPALSDINTDLDFVPRGYHGQHASYSTPNLRPPPSMSQHEPHLHPISSDRFQHPSQQRSSPVEYQNKRPRLDIPSPHSMSHSAHHGQLDHAHSSSSSDDPTHFHSAGPPSVGGSGYSYHPARPIWPPQPPPTSSIPHHPSRPLSRSHPSSHQRQQQPDHYPHYNLPFPHYNQGDGRDTPSMPPSFNSPHSEFALQPLQTPSSHPSHRPHSASMSSTGGDSAFFPSRPPRSVDYDGIFGTGRGPPASGEGPRGDSFAALLDPPNHTRAGLPPPPKGSGPSVPRGTTSAASFGLDWPMHASSNQGPPPPPPPPSAVSSDGNKSADIKSDPMAEGGGGDVGWLDLLSGGNSGPSLDIATPFVPSMSPAPGSTPKESLGASGAQRLSWERGGGGESEGDANGNNGFPSAS